MNSRFFSVNREVSVWRLSYWCILPLVLIFLVACGEKKLYPCPPVFLLKDAHSLTRYISDQAQDITKIVSQIKIKDFKGFCHYNKNWTKVNFTLDIFFKVVRGPSAIKKNVVFEYFIAIPKFYPLSLAKKKFLLKTSFTKSQTVQTLKDSVKISFPIKNVSQINDYSVFLGLQLVPLELKEILQEKQF